MLDYAWLVPALPLVGVLINGIFGRFIPRKLLGAFACALVGVSFVLAAMVFYQLIQLPASGRHISHDLYTWIAAGSFRATFGILLDPLSVFMMLIVTFVGFFIHVYSTGYMGDDPGYSRFFTYMNLFTASMLILVMANNYLLLFMGWELVGICSYLLIGFWYDRPAAVAAGKKAFITTRIGDVGFTLGVVMIFWTFGSVGYDYVFRAAPGVAAGAITAISILLLIGAIGKSAQIPLHVWLPDAMEGPTPVSAFIHAATMVTAGVYLIARSSPIYIHAPDVLFAVAVIGILTAFFAATIAMVNNDIKRVLAYSTISQIGFMFVGVGVGAFAAGMFHLLTHAFFKALLFLCAGSVMHALGGETDMRKMGGLRSKMPVTYWTFVIGALAISGITIFSGFFSKDEILAAAYELPNNGRIIYTLGVITSLLTAFYIFRAVYKTFHGSPRMPEEKFEHVHESSPSMTIPLVVLSIGATFAGFLGIPAFFVKASRPWTNLVGNFLAPALAQPSGKEAAAIPPALGWTLITIAVAAGVVGILMAWFFYVRRPGTAAKIAERMPWAYSLVYHKYWVDEVYNFLFVRPGRALATFLWKTVDEGIIDATVNGIAAAVGGLSQGIRRLETGYIRNYALAIFAGAVILVGYLIINR